MSSSPKCTSCDATKSSQGSSTCPLWMADGRSFGDVVYTSRCEQQYKLQYEKKFTSSFDYRQFLIQNAEDLMTQNNKMAQTRLVNQR